MPLCQEGEVGHDIILLTIHCAQLRESREVERSDQGHTTVWPGLPLCVLRILLLPLNISLSVSNERWTFS